MNLVILSKNNISIHVNDGLNDLNQFIKVRGEYPLDRILRVARNNGIQKAYYVFKTDNPRVMRYMDIYNFGMQVTIIEENRLRPLSQLLTLKRLHLDKPTFLIVEGSVFSESEFSEFATYSQMQKDADGIVAVARYKDDQKPVCVAMNDKDIILKFSDSREGYSWATAGLYYFNPQIFKEFKIASDNGIIELKDFLQFLLTKMYVLKGFSFSEVIQVENILDAQKAEALISGDITSENS